MRAQTDPIAIVCAADRGYVRPLAGMVASLLEHLPTGQGVRIYVLDGGIHRDDRERLTAWCADHGAEARFIPARGARLSGVPLWGRMTVTTYYKLALADLLPPDEQKVIWLDCDLIVQADISRLWQADLAGRCALAVPDSIVPRIGCRDGVAGHRDIGLAPDEPYFNAGVMVIDLERWRREYIGPRALGYVRSYRRRVWYWDQEGLNAVLVGRWGALDPRWNYNAARHAATTDLSRQWIVHFAGNLKPWSYDGHVLGPVFFRYLDRSPWAGWRPPPTLSGRLIQLYERFGVRSVASPLEMLALRGLRFLTRHSAEAHS